jgi:hypothetical protein
MYRILNVRPQPIQNLPEETGTELNQIIMRSLEKNRDLRYPSAKELSADLEEYLFYLKSLKFRRRSTTPVPSFQEGVTQSLPLDQLPVTSRRDKEIPPTMAADVQNMPTYNIPSPNIPAPSPTFGVPPPPEKVPRTGLGANYSETAAQVLIQKPSAWADKKFYVLGIVMALLFVGGLLYFGTLGKGGEALTIISNPVGAEVFANGQKIGITPTTLQERKDVELTFRLDGYQDRKISLKQANWPTELNILLERSADVPGIAKKMIQVTSNPAGALLQLDGKEIGPTPAEITLTDTEPHQIVLKMEGHQDITQSINATSASPLNIDLVPIAPPTGFVKYSGEPRVTIFSGSKVLKGSPVELEEGTHKLSFRSGKNAYVRLTKTVEVKAGETTVVRGPEMGQVTIKAIPSNCRIHINGEFIDVAPILSLPIQSGTHTITFNWETLNKKVSKTVTIGGDQNETVTGVPESN